MNKPLGFNIGNHIRSAGGEPHRALWLAVVAHVVQTEPEGAVLAWLRSSDGKFVCSLAGVEPAWVARLAARWTEENMPDAEAA